MPGVRVCRDQPARGEGVPRLQQRRASHPRGPRVRRAPRERGPCSVDRDRCRQGREPRNRPIRGPTRGLTRGRPQRARRYGEAYTHLAGSKTPGRHGNIVSGTREPLRLAWPIVARPAR